MKNKKYIEPEIEITTFNAQDIIATSDHGNKEDEGIILPDEEW